ncbi:MAG: hypothetical protein IMZ52_00530 [Actinobacteria bacterium]|jgi:acetoin utilization protein AcuC|nr:hypothetical protein [Actinomycetota bacterium]HZK12833.1 hypothetical protein [Atribacterota bacterium]
MKTIVIYSNKLKNYDFGEGHPFRSNRFEKFLELFKEKLGKEKSFELKENNSLATEEELELWHTKAYIKVIQESSQGGNISNLFRFIGTGNVNPFTKKLPPGIEEGARAIVKNSLLAIDYNQQRKAEKVISIGGGLHHAMSDFGEGFCIYNDVVIAAKYAIEKYNLKRVLILDTDAHAGNGTCKAFYSDPKVLFVDIHQEGIYPETGSVDEIGEGKGKGFTVNLPLEAGTGDKAYELIFDEIIFPLAREYKPEMIIRYGGSDPYFDDELTNLGLTLDGFEMIGKKVWELSRELCENRSVDLLCSGYNLEVLPKIWLTLVAAISGVKINFKESAPNIRDRKITETKNLIEKVKGKLAPYWKFIQRET